MNNHNDDGGSVVSSGGSSLYSSSTTSGSSLNSSGQRLKSALGHHLISFCSFIFPRALPAFLSLPLALIQLLQVQPSKVLTAIPNVILDTFISI